MEFCDGGDLATLIEKRNIENNKFSENVWMRVITNFLLKSFQEVLKVLIDGVCALRVIHGHHMIHRDVKPGNMLIDVLGVYKMSFFFNH
jgi:serine/threonine protein kinase